MRYIISYPALYTQAQLLRILKLNFRILIAQTFWLAAVPATNLPRWVLSKVLVRTISCFAAHQSTKRCAPYLPYCPLNFRRVREKHSRDAPVKCVPSFHNDYSSTAPCIGWPGPFGCDVCDEISRDIKIFINRNVIVIQRAIDIYTNQTHAFHEGIAANIPFGWDRQR